MSKIEELLKNEKVEWKRLDEIFYIRTGYTPSKNVKEYWENGEIDWFTIEDIRNRGRILEYANVKISKKGVKKDAFKKNSIILSIIATIGEYALIKTNFVVNQQFMVFTTKEEYDSKINMNFMNYYFSKVSEYCRKNRRVGNVPTVDTQKILKLEIPIPSIETQEKIVKTLDKFTNYVTELQAELQARTKQYDYYRDMLLSEEYLNKITAEIMGSDTLLKFDYLEDVSDVRDGTHDSPKKQTHGKFLITSKNIKNGSVIYDNAYYISEDDYSNINKRSKVDIDDLLFTMIGTIGEIAHIKEQPDFAIKNVGLIKNNGKMLSRYLFYYLNSTFIKSYIEQNKSKGSQVFISLGNLRKMKIPVPPIKVQGHIVEILDKFDTLVNDISKGLPKEIELRQKQYEYYREKLLSFNK